MTKEDLTCENCGYIATYSTELKYCVWDLVCNNCYDEDKSKKSFDRHQTIRDF